MSTNTTNYNLVKPDYSEAADIAVINGNMDIIDTAMKNNATDITSLTSSKQNVTDNSFATTSKTVPGAINELNSGKQNSLYGGSLTNTDFNTVRQNGYYWVGTGNTNVAVSGAYGFLEVIATASGSTSALMQRFTRFGADTASTRGEVYVRFYANNQWYGWNKIAQVIT